MNENIEHHSTWPRTITQHALTRSLKRRHARNGHAFHVTRRHRWYSDLGFYYLVNEGNYVVHQWGSIEALQSHAREIGVLAAHEEVAS